MLIDIRHCNSIDAGQIRIDEHRLNIKYAMNGAGKSTIARAIELHTRGDGSISALTPFKYLAAGDAAHAPNIPDLMTFHPSPYSMTRTSISLPFKRTRC